MELGLQGRAAVVAGGSRASGRATAELLAREGCRVAVLARTPKDLRETEEELLTLRRRRTRSASSATCSTPARSKPRSRSSTNDGASARAREHRRPRARRWPRRPHRRRLARRVRPRRAHDDPHHACRAPAAAQGDVRPDRERGGLLDPSPEPRAHRVHRGESGDGERVEEPLAGARARRDHRQHRCAGHGDVAHARPRTSSAPTSKASRKDRSKPPTRPSRRLRRVERHRPRRAPEEVAPVVVFLCSEVCELRGRCDHRGRRRYRLLLVGS